MPKTAYTAWRADDFPKRQREIISVRWSPKRLCIEVAEAWNRPPSLAIGFQFPRAYQGIDEGYRLRDIPIGEALIYHAGSSDYLTAFLENSAHTMDNIGILHWLIISANQCVDVLSESEPVVTQFDQT